MDQTALERVIDDAFERRTELGADTDGPVRAAVDAALAGLDAGCFRVAEKIDGEWRVHQWLKKAVLLSFRLNPLRAIEGGPGGARWWDKVPSKFASWGEPEFMAAGFRAVPGCVVRHSAHIARDVVLMPCFVNVGAYVACGTMIDPGATGGSAASPWTRPTTTPAASPFARAAASIAGDVSSPWTRCPASARPHTVIPT